MFTTQNIGRGNSLFNYTIDNKFTQVLVLNENKEIVAQFFGPLAKRMASQFCAQMNRIEQLCGGMQ